MIGAALTRPADRHPGGIFFRTRLVREDAAIGLVFPALFSIAVILISRFAGQVHLDTDAVLLGELASMPPSITSVSCVGYDLGPSGGLPDGRHPADSTWPSLSFFIKTSACDI